MTKEACSLAHAYSSFLHRVWLLLKGGKSVRSIGIAVRIGILVSISAFIVAMTAMLFVTSVLLFPALPLQLWHFLRTFLDRALMARRRSFDSMREDLTRERKTFE